MSYGSSGGGSVRSRLSSKTPTHERGALYMISEKATDVTLADAGDRVS